MKNSLIKLSILFLLFSMVFISCSTSDNIIASHDNIIASQEPISNDVLNQIKTLGFSSDNVRRFNGGYIVEGDIFLSSTDIVNKGSSSILKVATTEQYRTTNLLQNLPRVITVSVSSDFASTYVTATDVAIARYNALGLPVAFQRVASNGNIVISRNDYLGTGILGISGFPSSTGNPCPTIQLNQSLIGSTLVNYIATIIAHEIGHCIGMRHTDYFDRSSCNVHGNEGDAGVGVILISDTPSGIDVSSWMLACIGTGVDRLFTSYDVLALNVLYGVGVNTNVCYSNYTIDSFSVTLYNTSSGKTTTFTTTPDDVITQTKSIIPGVYNITITPITHFQGSGEPYNYTIASSCNSYSGYYNTSSSAYTVSNAIVSCGLVISMN